MRAIRDDDAITPSTNSATAGSSPATTRLAGHSACFPERPETGTTAKVRLPSAPASEGLREPTVPDSRFCDNRRGREIASALSGASTTSRRPVVRSNAADCSPAELRPALLTAIRPRCWRLAQGGNLSRRCSRAVATSVPPVRLLRGVAFICRRSSAANFWAR